MKKISHFDTRHYAHIFELEPQPWQIILAFSVVILGMVGAEYLPDWLGTAFIAFASILLCLWAGPKWLSWQFAMWLTHYESARRIALQSEKSIELQARGEILTQYERIIACIARLDNERLKVALMIPSPLELEFYPDKLDFLVLPRTGRRVPMEIVRQLVMVWLELFNKGRRADKLPPINCWGDGAQRALIKDIYDEALAQNLLLVMGSSQDWSSGSAGATLAHGVTPYAFLQWLRVSDEFMFDSELVEIDYGEVKNEH